MHKILTLNNIAQSGLDRFPLDHYRLGKDFAEPDAILLRSYDLHKFDAPASVRAVGRAGAGTNNIPIAAFSKRGVPVFNTPGANANAVKELVVTGMLLAARNIPDALNFVATLDPQAPDLDKRIEDGKKQFVGSELPRKVLGVVGLGAIGVQVANAARALGMRVMGYDPHMTIEGAWKLSSDVEKAASLQDLLSHADFVSVHVPLNDATRGIIGSSAFRVIKHGAVLLNFSREAIVDEEALLTALDEKRLARYVSDFPSAHLIGHRGAISLPHLGASTEEAEENCAVMVADQVRDYLERGNVSNSVNFPNLRLAREGAARLCVANLNQPNMIGQLSQVLGNAKLNIVQMQNASRGEIAYNVLDVETAVDADAQARIREIPGILSVRVI
jgi:D-3-phosphoglycerate dehydrogenase / 2-oxoglutarate reductase